MANVLLVGGRKNTEGIVVLRIHGTVNALVDGRGWEKADANVVCRSLGFTYTYSHDLSIK